MASGFLKYGNTLDHPPTLSWCNSILADQEACVTAMATGPCGRTQSEPEQVNVHTRIGSLSRFGGHFSIFRPETATLKQVQTPRLKAQ